MFESNHIYKSGKNVVAHTMFAFVAGFVLIFAGIISIIHAFLPFLFPYYVEIILQKLLKKNQELKIR